MRKIFYIFQMLYFSIFSQSEYKSAFGCGTPQYFSYIDINNIKSPVFSGGDMHSNIFSNGLPSYEFPKGSLKAVSGASSIWIGGLDIFGQLKIAAQTYRQSGVDFWTGPLNDIDASNDFNSCLKYDNIWKINYTDINEMITNYNNGYIHYNLYTPKSNILNFPISIEDNYGYKQHFSKFNDNNNDGIYNPKEGCDYPVIKGDQSLFFTFNDNGGIHQATGGRSIGLQINAIVYAYGCPEIIYNKPELLNTTFYNYKIYNKSNSDLKQAYIGIWVDANIGDGSDDFVGSNPQQGYMYGYNGDNYDNVYGDILPATGTVILKAPKAPLSDGIDNDNDGIIDELNEELLIANMYYFNINRSGFSGNIQSEPTNAVQYYNYLKGQWKDSSPITCGDSAFGGLKITSHVFPGTKKIASDSCGINWTEITANNKPGNRTYLMSMGPINLNAKDSTEIEFAFVTSIDSNSVGNSSGSILKLENDITKIKNFYNTPLKPSCILKVEKNIFNDEFDAISIFPNPNNGIISVNSYSFIKNNAILKIIDLLGKTLFETTINSEFKTINLMSFSSGIYTLSIEQNKKIQFHKVIKL